MGKSVQTIVYWLMHVTWECVKQVCMIKGVDHHKKRWSLRASLLGIKVSEVTQGLPQMICKFCFREIRGVIKNF